MSIYSPAHPAPLDSCQSEQRRANDGTQNALTGKLIQLLIHQSLLMRTRIYEPANEYEKAQNGQWPHGLALVIRALASGTSQTNFASHKRKAKDHNSSLPRPLSRVHPRSDDRLQCPYANPNGRCSYRDDHETSCVDVHLHFDHHDETDEVADDGMRKKIDARY